MSGPSEEKKPDEEGGLDARLDKAVPTETAVGFLLVGDGSQPGRVFPLTRNTSVVGRGEHVDVRISQPAVSSEHARITSSPHGFEIEDLGSVNGTFVNGVKIQRAKLQRGDRLTLGNVEFTFLVEKTPDATMALLPPRPRRTTGAAQLAGLRPVTYAAAGVARPIDDDEDGVSFGEVVRKGVGFYRTIRPHFPLVARFLGFGLVLGIGSALAIPPPSRAVCEAKLHAVKKANPIDPNSANHQEGDELQFFVDAERNFVHPALVKSTIEKLEGKAPSDERVGEVADRLKLANIGERLYRASYSEPTFGVVHPKEIPALKLLSSHIDNYITTDVERGLRVLDNESKFLSEKLAAASADLTRINDELAAFKKANADDLPDTAGQTQQSRYYLDAKKVELQSQIAKLSGELAVDVTSYSEGSPQAGSKFTQSQVYRSSLQELKRKLNEAYARGLADGHPEVMQMKTEMASLERVIDQEMNAETKKIDQASDPAISGLRARIGIQKAQLRAAQIELGEVERNLERVKRAVTTMPAIAARLDDLQRKYDSTKRLHDQLSDQAQRARLQLEVEREAAKSRYELLTPVIVQTPGKAKTFALRAAIGLVAGLFIAIFIVFVREARQFILRHMPPPSGA